MTLSIIGTPIGNLEDVTLRGLRILGQADYIVCEDTRVSQKLLAHYKIKKPLISLHGRSSENKMAQIVSLLEQGSNLAYITDAGTPSISDPGASLVRIVREKVPDAVIEVIPGPSALTAAIAVSGAPVDNFCFYGFLPHKKGRESLLKLIASSKQASIFYESTHRILKALKSLLLLCQDRKISVCKELTKIHEKVIEGTVSEVISVFESDAQLVKGEFTIIVWPL